MKKHLLMVPFVFLGLTFSLSPGAVADSPNYSSGYYYAPPPVYYGQYSGSGYRNEPRYRQDERNREDRQREEEHRDYRREDH